MGKLKVKDVVGDPNDIRLLFKEGGCDLACYLGTEAARKKVSAWWILLLTCALFILSCCIWTDAFNAVWHKIAILAVFFVSFLILLIVHSNYRSKTITAIVTIAFISNISIILKVYSPQEVAKKIERITVDNYKTGREEKK